MFGRTTRLPIDVFLGTEEDYSSEVEAIRDRLQEAYELVKETSRNRGFLIFHVPNVYMDPERGYAAPTQGHCIYTEFTIR